MCNFKLFFTTTTEAITLVDTPLKRAEFPQSIFTHKHFEEFTFNSGEQHTDFIMVRCT